MEFNATFLATIVTFITFVIIMNWILYTPILSIMEKRKKLIEENYKQVQDNNTKSAELITKKEEKLAIAKGDARDSYNETVNVFKKQSSEIIEKAQISAKEEIKQSEIKLQQISNVVKNELKDSMLDLANDIVEKVIGYRSEVQSFDEEIVNKVLWEK